MLSEIEIFTAAQSTAQIAHGEPIEFLADVLSGPDTCEVCCPIRIASDRKVGPGEPLIADVVVRANGYWGDSAETHVRGANTEVEEARAVLLEILELARAELVPGTTGQRHLPCDGGADRRSLPRMASSRITAGTHSA